MIHAAMLKNRTPTTNEICEEKEVEITGNLRLTKVMEIFG